MKKAPAKKKYRTAIEFTKEMIAPCGMNCGSCLGYMRDKDHCPGCRTYDPAKPGYCRQCIIIRCDQLKETESKFCYECPKYPCTRLKALDKRYKTKYNTSFFDNLSMIKEKGIKSFLDFETERRSCQQCGATICVHRPQCFECGNTAQRDNQLMKTFND
jgi:nickel-dependent lactate racemase